MYSYITYASRQVGELTESVTKRGMEALATALPDSVANRLQMGASASGPCTPPPPLFKCSGLFDTMWTLVMWCNVMWKLSYTNTRVLQRSGRACARRSASTRWRATRSSKACARRPDARARGCAPLSTSAPSSERSSNSRSTRRCSRAPRHSFLFLSLLLLYCHKTHSQINSQAADRSNYVN